MTMKRLFFLVLCFCLFSGLALARASLGPTEELKPTLDKIIEILADPDLAGSERKAKRREKIMAVAVQRFDFAEMSKRVLGKTWKTIDEQQRVYFEQLFTKLLENAYIGKMESYSGGQDVQYQEERIKGQRAVVNTVVDDNGIAIPVRYVMLQKESIWKVYDINIEGVSLVRNYREQFKSILRKDKFDGLVKIQGEENTQWHLLKNSGRRSIKIH